VLHTPQQVGSAHAIKEMWNVFRLSNLVIRRLTKCTVMPSFTWCNVCRHIMIELLSVIDCLCFFSIFSLLATKVYNCPLFVCCLFGHAKPKSLRSPWLPDLILLLFSDLNLSICFRGIWVFSSSSVVIKRLFGVYAAFPIFNIVKVLFYP